ncbi:MAG: sigma 54-interacting transcriptional regulator [Desulfosarcinaceae bacterium]|nr:sigma 54-interacting transcriptional regulator [Desulfosarcinaceae bacterium]
MIHGAIRSDQWLEVLDELNVGAFTVNTDHQITAINYNAQALLGLRGPEVTGLDCREVFTGVPCLGNCQIAIQNGTATETPDVVVTDETDSDHLITRMATPLFDNEGQVMGCLTILQDHTPITELVDRVHYEARRQKIILDSLDLAVFTVNRGGLITFFNTTAERITGFNRQGVLGRPAAQLFGGADRPEIQILHATMTSGRSHRQARGRLLDRDGVGVPIRANYMVLRNEKETVVGGLVTFRDLALEVQLDQAIRGRYTCRDMIGKSPAMQRIFEMVPVVADSDASVLIEGATGTGKDLLAKVIHGASPRAGRAFIKVNCASLPEQLLESELFGYVKGAFTGAVKDKPGRFQLAAEGTILLDEIGDLPLNLQAKLLRVLEDKEFYPLGSRHTVKVDVRILSATNRGLDGLVQQQLFREDLFYRLNVLRLELPPLVERRDDLPLLIRHVSRRLCAARGRQLPAISRGALDHLLNHRYPGNVRELENILEHALILCQEGSIRRRHLPTYLQEGPPAERGFPIGTARGSASERIASGALRNGQVSSTVISAASQEGASKEGVSKEEAAKEEAAKTAAEKARIRAQLHRCHGHRAKTARALGMDRTTLWRKMKRYNIQ